MGTETISCTYCLNSSSGECVKLNNPLMGTETCFHFQMYLQCLVILVKLNNPLMGTETHVSPWLRLHDRWCAVKLNNPLMGTETIAHSFLK